MMARQCTMPWQSFVDHAGAMLELHGTDTLPVVHRDNEVVATRDVDANPIVDLDKGGHLMNLALAHDKKRAKIANFIDQQVAVCKAA